MQYFFTANIFTVFHTREIDHALVLEIISPAQILILCIIKSSKSSEFSWLASMLQALNACVTDSNNMLMIANNSHSQNACFQLGMRKTRMVNRKKLRRCNKNFFYYSGEMELKWRLVFKLLDKKYFGDERMFKRNLFQSLGSITENSLTQVRRKY